MTPLDTGRDAPARPDPAVPPSFGMGLLLLRVFVGVAMAGHGAQKLFGLFGGAGPGGTADFFESVGYSPGLPYALLSGLVELGAGILLVLGLGTSLAAAAITANMMGAYAAKQAMEAGDFFAAAGGPELELLFVVAAFALILTGPGVLALRLGFLDGPKLRLLSIVLAIGGSVAAVLIRGG